MTVPNAPNERWSLDFVSDQLTDGRRFRILTIVDDCTRECLALVADTSLSGVRVARELDRLLIERGKPKTVVSDNGSELISNAILIWADHARVEWYYIAPGKPMQNAFIESFNGRTGRASERDAVHVARPGSSLPSDAGAGRTQLGWKGPFEFASTFRPRRDLALCYAESSAPDPIANTARRLNTTPGRWIELGSNVNRTLLCCTRICGRPPEIN
jgi:putative transposase